MAVKDKIIAHRGVFNNDDIPENSMKAFKKAISLNYSFELDVQLTKDNVLVVFHDFDLKRMTGISKKLSDCSYDELLQYHLLNTKEKIPTLKQVLELNQDKVMIDIEIKNTKKIKFVCEKLIEELVPYHNFILKSFNPRVVRYLKKHYPELEVGYLIEKRYDRKLLQLLLPSLFMIHYSKADFLAIHKKLLSTKKFQKLENKYPIFVWTIKNKNEISDKEKIIIYNNMPYKNL